MSKISDMQGSSPLEGNELVPVVQSGVNVTTTPDAIAELVDARMEIVGSLPDPTTQDIGKFVLFDGSIWVVVEDDGTNVFQEVSGGSGGGGGGDPYYYEAVSGGGTVPSDIPHMGVIRVPHGSNVTSLTLPGSRPDGMMLYVINGKGSGTISGNFFGLEQYPHINPSSAVILVSHGGSWNMYSWGEGGTS